MCLRLCRLLHKCLEVNSRDVLGYYNEIAGRNRKYLMPDEIPSLAGKQEI